jgi:hypothetical protein
MKELPFKSYSVNLCALQTVQVNSPTMKTLVVVRGFDY